MSLPLLFSYIDPVSGSILVQVIIAAIIGSIAFFRRSLGGFVRTVFRWKRSGNESSK